MPTSMDPDASQPPPGARSPAADRAEPLLADPDDFGAVFDRYFGEIHGYAARRVGRDAAADIAADTFLTAFRLRRRFDPGRGTVKAWLYGIATNHLSVHHRAKFSYGTVASRLSRARTKLRTAAGLARPEQGEPQGQEEPPARATPRGREGRQEDPRHG